MIGGDRMKCKNFIKAFLLGVALEFVWGFVYGAGAMNIATLLFAIGIVYDIALIVWAVVLLVKNE